MVAQSKPFGIYNVQGAFKTKAIIPIRTKNWGGEGRREIMHQHSTEKEAEFYEETLHTFHSHYKY